jgi:hypothetical protein
VLYSDGTLVAQNIKLPGSIQWTEASSPSKNLYGADNTTMPQGSYGDFNDNTGAWHKVYNEKTDRYYCHTDNGGATWQGPFLVTGKSITETITEYQILAQGKSESELKEITTGWLPTMPSTTVS